jgi:hypothetical protein
MNEALEELGSNVQKKHVSQMTPAEIALIESYRKGFYRPTNHCTFRSKRRNVGLEDVINAILLGEIIEYFIVIEEGTGKYQNRVMFRGFTKDGRPVYAIADVITKWIVTAYVGMPYRNSTCVYDSTIDIEKNFKKALNFSARKTYK